VSRHSLRGHACAVGVLLNMRPSCVIRLTSLGVSLRYESPPPVWESLGAVVRRVVRVRADERWICVEPGALGSTASRIVSELLSADRRDLQEASLDAP